MENTGLVLMLFTKKGPTDRVRRRHPIGGRDGKAD